MNNLAPNAQPAPLASWEPTIRELAVEDRAWDRWEQDYDYTDEE
ncbi:hypothetical protein AB0M92_19050 [Streptomyces sp. NPDC051582]